MRKYNEFDGIPHVNFSHVYPTLSKKCSSTDWVSRLRIFGLTPSLCKFTSRDHKPLKLTDKGRKCVWIPTTLYTKHVKPYDKKQSEDGVPGAPDVHNEDASHGNSTSENDSDAGAAPESMDTVTISDAERFVFEGNQLVISMYGKRTPNELFLDFQEALQAFGVRHRDRIPGKITPRTVIVSGEPRDVISYRKFIGLAAFYDEKHPVAACLMDWIVHVVFSANFGGGVRPQTQAEFVARDFAYRPSIYFDDVDTVPILYAMDVCTVLRFEEVFPGTALSLVPPGRDPADFIVCKPGCGDGKTRPSTVRGNLKILIPGCDPRPFAIERFPEATNTLLRSYETKIHDEIAESRIKGVYFHGREYTELFVVDRTTMEIVIRKNMWKLSEKHRLDILESVRSDLHDATEIARVARGELSEALADRRVQDEVVAGLNERVAGLNERVEGMDRVMATLQVSLPRKTASIVNALLRPSS